MTPKVKFLIKIVFSIAFILSIITTIIGYNYYTKIYKPNVLFTENTPDYFYIPTGSKYEEVSQSLFDQGFITNKSSFDWVAEIKKYPVLVKPGKYKIKNRMSNEELINMLRIGEQVPVNITFNNIRLKTELAGQLAQQIEADSIDLINALTDVEIQKKYGFNKHTFISMFIPNTYQLKWNTNADQLISRMAKEYKKFWNKKRKTKLQNIGLSQSEVASLAAVVQKETSKNDEKPMVAGVYMNRLKKGMLLQADPTVIFAIGDFTIKRVLKKQLEYDSPYNTYKYKGLPPGPICLPEITSLDAVLNYKSHNYTYFCAKEDFSGYHNFAKTYAEHRRNAKKWYRAMNAKKVYK